MIINIRGTSGSGKTTLVREIMDLYEDRKPHFISGRKRPICYTLSRRRESFGGLPLAVLGSYENVCGGMDTIPDREEAYKLIRFWHAKKHDVLFEGLLYSDEFNRTAKLTEDGIPLLVISLTTSLNVCLERINRRRQERDPNAGKVNPNTTTVRIPRIARTVERLAEAGVKTALCNNAQASILIRETLGLPLEA